MAQIDKNYTPIRPSANAGAPRDRELLSDLASKKHPPLVFGQIYGVLVIPFILSYIIIINNNLIIINCTLYQNARNPRHTRLSALSDGGAIADKWRKCTAFNTKINYLREN